MVHCIYLAGGRWHGLHSAWDSVCMRSISSSVRSWLGCRCRWLQGGRRCRRLLLAGVSICRHACPGRACIRHHVVLWSWHLSLRASSHVALQAGRLYGVHTIATGGDMRDLHDSARMHTHVHRVRHHATTAGRHARLNQDSAAACTGHAARPHGILRPWHRHAPYRPLLPWRQADSVVRRGLGCA